LSAGYPGLNISTSRTACLAGRRGRCTGLRRGAGHAAVGNKRQTETVRSAAMRRRDLLPASAPSRAAGASESPLEPARCRHLRLAASTAPWTVVCFHHSPYSSSAHGSDPDTQWPFRAWGADLVLTGHDHSYGRLSVDGVTYVVNGLGGQGIYSFNDPLPQSEFRYNADHGAELLEATDTTLTASFYNSGELQPKKLIDRVTLDKNAPPQAVPASFQQNVAA